ncbi:hypothetical protein [Microbacterium paulum]
MPPCPDCAEPYAYAQGALMVCPICGPEWLADAADAPGGAPVVCATRSATSWQTVTP